VYLIHKNSLLVLSFYYLLPQNPFTGYYGKEADKQFLGNRFSKEIMLKEALASARRMLKAEEKSEGKIAVALH